MTEKINPADAIRLLDAHEAVAVDVREPDEYAVGHIPGAKLLPLGQVLTRAAEVDALADRALQQIDVKKYDTELRDAGVRPIIKIGIAFRGKTAVVKRK